MLISFSRLTHSHRHGLFEYEKERMRSQTYLQFAREGNSTIAELTHSKENSVQSSIPLFLHFSISPFLHSPISHE